MPDDATSAATPSPAVHDQGAVHRVALRIPPFWSDKPELWFCQLEAQFQLNQITQDSTKFWYVTGQLESRFAEQVEDILLKPPQVGKYDTLKYELIKRLSSSQQHKIKQLLEHEEIGDRTPSQFMRHLKKLAGSTVHEEFLRTLWLSRLPAVMQAILATQSDLTIDKIAEIADKIQETHSTHSQIASTSPKPNTMETLAEQIRQLTLQVNELSKNKRFSQPRSRSNSRGPQNNKTSQQNAEHCWYHTRYGANAKKCREPCSFKSDSGNATTRH